MTTEAPADFLYVDTDARMEQALRILDAARSVALDTEADSLHSYHEKVCLIQISVNGSHFIVDPLAEADLAPLLRRLASLRLILHGADYDLRMLRGSFGFRPGGEIFDTMLAAQLLGYDGIGLAAVAQNILGVTLSKRGQRSDWSRRPLTTAQLRYAVDDTRYLPEIEGRLRSELKRKGRLEWHRESCERMVQATAQDHPARDPEDAWRIRGLQGLNARELACVREIWRWREREAEKADRPPFKIMPNQQIVQLSQWAVAHPDLPLSEGPKLPRHCTGRRFKGLESAIRRARDLPESKLPEHRRGRWTRPSGPDIRPQLQYLREKTAGIARDLGIEPSVLAPKSALAALARERPEDLEGVMRCSHLMRWQAEFLLPVVRGMPAP